MPKTVETYLSARHPTTPPGMIDTMDEEQRRALNGLARIAAALGLGAVLFAGAGARALGMPAERRSLWPIRLFGVRELCLAYGLARAARSGDRGQGRLMADLVTAAQAGDSLLAAVLLARGELSWRLALIVWSGVAPTLLGTRIARGRCLGRDHDEGARE